MTENIVFAPLVPFEAIGLMALLALPFLASTIWRGRRGGWYRTGLFAVLFLALANPQALQERREGEPDVVIVAVDNSQSQAIAGRQQATQQALDHVTQALDRLPAVDYRIVSFGGEPLDEAAQGTSLFGAVDQALSDIPLGRLGGVVMITDGQVHDRSDSFLSRKDNGPLHVLLTGRPNERDRRLVVEQAPGFGIIGQTVDIQYRIEDQLTPAEIEAANPVKVTVSLDGNPFQTIFTGVNETDTLSIEIDRPGRHLIEMTVEAADGELSADNNAAAIRLNGVHDRMRVLLISGQPHVGERTWRDLLKSDAAIDLIHFTILRPPEKDDFTPLRELALIVFPVKELFQDKLEDFDLIVFDRYMVRDVLPPSYIRNITSYVENGGAVLLSVGPEFAGPRSLFRTPLADVIPASPSGRVIEEPFKPKLTDLGRKHPVTAGLSLGGDLDSDPTWGRWFRQVDVRPGPGVTVMTGPEDAPLLVLNRFGEGRVAQLNSDQVWLWARDFEGGGPHQELMRRIAHWLMKEPELEEEALTAFVRDGQLSVVRRSLEAAPETVQVETPAGTTETLDLVSSDLGFAEATMGVRELGVYRVSDGTQVALAVAGSLNPVEFRDLRATDQVLSPMVEARGGSMTWGDTALPAIRAVKSGRDIAGRGWIGVLENESYRVTGIDRVSLMPWWLTLTLALGFLFLSWRKEGR